MASFRFDLDKDFKTIDEKIIGGIDGYKAIHYACNWLSNHHSSNAKSPYIVHIEKKDNKIGLFRYYCSIYMLNGQYMKMDRKRDGPINPETGRTITKLKKTVKRK